MKILLKASLLISVFIMTVSVAVARLNIDVNFNQPTYVAVPQPVAVPAAQPVYYGPPATPYNPPAPIYAAPVPGTTYAFVPAHYEYGQFVPGHYVPYYAPAPGPSYIWVGDYWDHHHHHHHNGHWAQR